MIDAHPRAGSFCHALAGAVVEGAEASLHEVRLLALRDLHFDPHHTAQELEPCLARCQENLLWAEHVVIVHPARWGTMPALLKGWLDRVLLPGFAFAEREDGLGLVLGMGCTAPPLRLVTRTWGEVTVALTHSVLVVLCGHLSQTGRIDLGLWLIALPIFFAVLPSIILAGFPDLEADASVGKKTIAVRFGRIMALKIAMAATGVAAVTRLCAIATTGSLTWADVVMGAHAAVLVTALWAFLQKPKSGRINGLLVLGLSYMIWFALAALLQV